VEWHQGELFPRVGFIMTNISAKSEGVVHFYNRRGTAKQWIKEGKYALNWARLSCHSFVANQVQLQLFIPLYGDKWFPKMVGDIVAREAYTGKAYYNKNQRIPNPNKPLGDLTM